MKRINQIKILILAVLMVVVGSCTKDFDEMNVNPNAATEVPATNVFGQAVLNATYILLGERLDIYYAGTWAGHTVHIGIGDYEYRVDINNSQWRSFYIAMSYFVDAMKLAEEEGNTNLYAAALTMKAYLAHKATDCWGKIPYSEAFMLEEGILYPKYDTEAEVYNQVLDELETAAGMFDPAGDELGDGDFLMKGDIDKWIKFCNSTRLRVATRMTAGDENAGKAVIADILGSPAANPLIEDNDDNAYLWWPGITPDQELWFERVGAPDGNKTDAYRTNHYMISALKANNDPRLGVYADPNKWGEYNGYQFGPDQSIDTMNNGNNVSHIGDRFGNDPDGFSPYFNAAEVYFLKAEAYERGFATGNAQQAYEMGITRSLEENGIDATAIATFLAEPEVAWGGGTTSNLEKIYLQKWLCLFKQSVEAWAEARRTDVPLMPDVEKNYSSSHNRPPFRMSYADEEKSLNTKFPTEVVESDIFWGTQMWWDKRSGVQ
ncbi:MAG: SusD/RagB family nutrient-binding outer membrane lipoprotein [Bacteroidales bacterium]|nr:SusD/RagB family nutrient-binding outer membrane lipoprotein [Bacteroidales bacterium]